MESKVKIAYKPVDKKAKIIEAIKRTTFLPPMRVVAETLADEIIAIDNAKENDGEIHEVSITKDRMTLSINEGDFSHCMLSLRIDTGLDGLSMVIDKQEAFELGQALIKMSRG